MSCSALCESRTLAVRFSQDHSADTCLDEQVVQVRPDAHGVMWVCRSLRCVCILTFLLLPLLLLLLLLVCCSGVFTPGKADSCVTSAMSYILTAPQPDPLEYNVLLADVGDKSTAARSR